MSRRLRVNVLVGCIGLVLMLALQMSAGTKLKEYVLLRTNVGKRLWSEGVAHIGVHGKRVTINGKFMFKGQCLPFGIWLVGSKSKMKLGETVYSDDEDQAEFYWSGNVDMGKFTDLAIYYLPRDNVSPGKGAIRILSLPVKRIYAATGRASASPKK